MKKEILTDEAINCFTDDLLDRKKFVKNLTSSLSNWHEEKSLVIGLFGKWGSGKSSVINLVESELEEANKKLSKEERKKAPIVINFNPWGYSESEDLLEPFINQVKGSLSGPNKIKGIADKLELYLEVLKLAPEKKDFKSFSSAIVAILSLVGISLPQVFPNVSTIVTGLGQYICPVLLAGSFVVLFFNTLIKAYKLFDSNEDKSVFKVKSEICKILKKENRKIIIIIDDIDRLSSKEIKQLFRIVRSNADFPNTIYLLSFDREIVEKSLDVQNRIDGREYLEKIINIEYDLPQISNYILNSILMKQLENLTKDFSEEELNIFSIENTKWSYVYNSILENITTIREIKRYINAVSFKLNQFINENVLEVNLIDFLAIEFIRLEFPDYYDFIRENKLWFITSRENLEYKIPNKKDDFDKWFADSFNDKYSKKEKDCLDCILAQIFPAIRYCAKDVSSILAPTSANINDKYCSIASEKYFDIYFNHLPGISDESCSNFDVQLIRTNAGNYDKLIQSFRQYITDGKILSLLKLLESCSLSGEFVSSECYVSYFSALFDILDELPEEQGLFTLGNQSTIFRIYYFLIKGDSKEKNAELLHELMLNTNSIFMLLYILNMDKTNLEKQNEQQMITTPQEYKKLSSELLQKIKDNKDVIIQSKFFNYLAYYWKNNDLNTFMEYVNSLVKTDEEFLKICDQMIWNSKAQIGTKLVEKKKFNFESFKLFVDLEEAKKRIENIKDKNENLYEVHKESIGLFLKYYNHRDDEFYM